MLLSSADEGMADNNLPGSETQMNALDNYYIALEARQLEEEYTAAGGC
jgi:hypothetical protein